MEMATKTRIKEAVEKYVLCRRQVQEIGEPVKYCARPIKKENSANWCQECGKRLPIWPQ